MPIYFPTAPVDQLLYIESIGENWPQVSLQRLQGYPYYHWLQTTKGQGEIILQQKTFQLRKGDGILLAPFVPHAYYPKGEWETSFVTFGGTLSSDIHKIVGNEPYLFVQENEQFSMESWINKMIATYLAQTSDSVALASSIFTFLCQLGKHRHQPLGKEHPLYDKYVLPVTKEIETNYMHDLTVEGLAASVFVSPQYLTRLFQRFLGVSTVHFLLNRRLTKAKELLVNQPQLEIQQVSFHSGFKDASYFGATFKKKTGATPLEFRRLHC